ncbi:Biglycan [Eumeta japonica]|uniref:Biglycan n=1 Tax=Eumeta variegata TaxID=151549 RepID=A0A4C1W256_EUMVA|nr:Biglycan [Eumeta japonica]GBP44569.1 Biglycan [Eumeta japonica]
MASFAFISVLLAIGMGEAFNGDNFELECPDECDCHYFRINWVTDCSESNLTEVPYDELSKSVYILDLNGNNITHLKRFPGDIKMRRLQIADNRLTKVEKEAFAGLEYLIDVDLSGNNITYVDPESFV